MIPKYRGRLSEPLVATPACTSSQLGVGGVGEGLYKGIKRGYGAGMHVPAKTTKQLATCVGSSQAWNGHHIVQRTSSLISCSYIGLLCKIPEIWDRRPQEPDGPYSILKKRLRNVRFRASRTGLRRLATFAAAYDWKIQSSLVAP